MVSYGNIFQDSKAQLGLHQILKTEVNRKLFEMYLVHFQEYFLSNFRFTSGLKVDLTELWNVG